MEELKSKRYLNPILSPITMLKSDLDDPYVSSFLPFTSDLLQNNYSRDQIKRELLNESQQKGRTLVETELLTIINKSQRNLSEQYDKDREFVVSLHLARYNEEINKRMNVDVSEFNKFRAKEVKNYSYLQALEALYQKEKVLGLHTKALQIKINNKNNVKVKVYKKRYKMENLTLSELIEMNSLVEKCKKSEDQISEIILREKPVVQETEDIEYTEIINDNVKQIAEKVVPFHLRTDTPNKNLLDVEEKMMETFRKNAEEEFKKIKK
jgi:hypothetical protein